MKARIWSQCTLIAFSIILLAWPACLFLPKPTPKPTPPEREKSLLIGNCTFQWRRGGGRRKENLVVTVEELISGKIYEGHTDKEGFYCIPNVPPGIYSLKSIRFLYQDLTVEHNPLIKLFIIDPGKVFYLGRFVVEVDTADLRKGKEYPCHEKYITGDLNEEELREILTTHKDGQGWADYEIILENKLEKF